MTKLVVLDDGISFFSDPVHIQKTYGKLWDEGIPICLGITPAIMGLVADSTVPADKHDDKTPFKVSQNERLCNYLNAMAEQRLVEICVRGYHGITDEFDGDDDILLQQKIEEGQSELAHAFPDADIKTFVFPPNQYAETAIQLLTEYDFNIVAFKAGSESAGTRRTALNDARALFEYGNRLQVKKPPKLTDDMILIVRTTYFDLFTDNIPNGKFAIWQSYLDKLLAAKNMTIDTISFI